jgi:DNA recombination protein RmuC
MELLATFAIGITVGIALGVTITIVVAWTKERMERQRTFDDFAGELRGATESMKDLFTDELGNRKQTFGSLSEKLHSSAKQTDALLQVTNALHLALSHPTIRGQWGERMVEDVLKPTGFQEGINYVKQTGMSLTSNRPDFTFLLPRGLKVNLDSKFPLDNYLAFYKAQTEEERRECKKRFLSDVRKRVKEVVGKEYINPAECTVDFVLVFIPNEQVYSFINVYDPSIFDDALMSKVVLCSPWTLYPVVSIIRTAIDNFILEKTTAALLPLMANFEKQWEAFNDCLEKMGKRIADAQKEHEQLVTTRHRQLDKVLGSIATLRQQTDFHAVEHDGLPTS